MPGLLHDGLDRLDERLARRIRRWSGRRRRLLSWEPSPSGGWLARVSCAEVPVTVVRRGRWRCTAIRRASQALAALQQSESQPPPAGWT